MTGNARDDSIAEIIAEFSQVFAFARTRWTRYAENAHPELRGMGMMMLQVITRKGPVTATDLTSMLDMDKATVSRQLATLRTLGLVDAAPSPEDRRVVVLTASERARQALDDLQRHSAEEYRARFTEWADEDLAQLQLLLHRFNAVADGDRLLLRGRCAAEKDERHDPDRPQSHGE